MSEEEINESSTLTKSGVFDAGLEGLSFLWHHRWEYLKHVRFSALVIATMLMVQGIYLAPIGMEGTQKLISNNIVPVMLSFLMFIGFYIELQARSVRFVFEKEGVEPHNPHTEKSDFRFTGLSWGFNIAVFIGIFLAVFVAIIIVSIILPTLTANQTTIKWVTRLFMLYLGARLSLVVPSSILFQTFIPLRATTVTKPIGFEIAITTLLASLLFVGLSNLGGLPLTEFGQPIAEHINRSSWLWRTAFAAMSMIGTLGALMTTHVITAFIFKSQIEGFIDTPSKQAGSEASSPVPSTSEDRPQS